MFGFFDRKKRKRQDALDQFAKNVGSTEWGQMLLNLAKRKHIVQRYMALRDAGNHIEADTALKEMLSEDLGRWEKSRDPNSLHFIAECFRLCSKPELCIGLLLGILEDRALRGTIDCTWIYIDIGLAKHQIGTGNLDVLKWFDLSLRHIPPVKARIVAGPNAKAQAAFCAFVTAMTDGQSATAKTYWDALLNLEPKFNWEADGAVREYSKKFIGFISPASTEQKLEEDDQGKSVDLPNQQKSTQEVFYYSILAADPTLPVTVSNSRIFAQSWADYTTMTDPEYGIVVYKGGDAFHLFKARAALYWRQQLDRQSVTATMCIEWLRAVERATGNRYIPGDYDHSGLEKGSALYEGCALLGLHTAIANIADTRFPEKVRNYYELRLRASGPGPWWHEHVQKAAPLSAAIAGGQLDLDLCRHLYSSVGLSHQNKMT